MATIESGRPSHGNGGERGGESASARNTGENQPRGIAEMVRETTYQRLDGQKDRATQTLGSFAGAVRGMTQPLRDGGQTTAADYVTRAADGIERWADQLRQQDIAEAVRGVERFARREPGLFLGIAFGAGLLAARFLKSSSRAQDEFRAQDEYRRWEGRSGSPTPMSQMAGPDAIPRMSGDLTSAREVV
jgi:hypothetical protein